MGLVLRLHKHRGHALAEELHVPPRVARHALGLDGAHGEKALNARATRRVVALRANDRHPRPLVEHLGAHSAAIHGLSVHYNNKKNRMRAVSIIHQDTFF
jgi:hypothetical protein